jgi:DNA replication protein DnaC
MDERVWQEMERLRQEQQRPARPMARREDLPRPLTAEDLLTSLNIRPGNTPTSLNQAPRTNPPLGNPPTPNRPASSPGQGREAAPPQRPAPAEPAKVVHLNNFATTATSPFAPIEDEFEPYVDQSVCPYCKGSGWLRLESPVGDQNFGKLVPCECTMALKDRKAFEELKKTSNIELFRDLTFESFNPRVPKTRDAYEAALKYAKDPSDWLLFIGNYGCGKTHLAAAIANEALNRHIRLYFAVVPDLLDYLRSTFDPNSEASYDQRFEMIRNVPLLILDDLGTENAKPWAREKLYQIINHRYNAKLPTVITTNNDLDSLDGRIRSRLYDRELCRTILLQADDYRMLDSSERARFRQNPVTRAKY